SEFRSAVSKEDRGWAPHACTAHGRVTEACATVWSGAGACSWKRSGVGGGSGRRSDGRGPVEGALRSGAGAPSYKRSRSGVGGAAAGRSDGRVASGAPQRDGAADSQVRFSSTSLPLRRTVTTFFGPPAWSNCRSSSASPTLVPSILRITSPSFIPPFWAAP